MGDDELQIGGRIGDEVHLAGLASEVERRALAGQHTRQQRLVAKVAQLERQPLLDSSDVEARAALIR
jgi:hypothetical protein